MDDSMRDKIHSMILVNNEFEGHINGAESLPDLLRRLRSVYGDIDESRVILQLEHFSGQTSSKPSGPVPTRKPDAARRVRFAQVPEYIPDGINIGRVLFSVVCVAATLVAIVIITNLPSRGANLDINRAITIFIGVGAMIVVAAMTPLRLRNLGVRTLKNQLFLTLLLFVPAINIGLAIVLFTGQRGMVQRKNLDAMGWVYVGLLFATGFIAALHFSP